MQRGLAARVEVRALPERVRRVAGAVVRGPRGTSGGGGEWWACAVCMSFPELEVVNSAVAPAKGVGRYVRGLRAFFEGEALVRALERLGERPEVVFLRGHGICHPRRLGLASHVGIVLDWPSVGCADALLWGRAEEPGARRGDWAPVLGESEEVVGAAVRVQQGRRPVYVSPGHRCDVEGAVGLTLACAPKFRLPEPLREARLREARLRAGRQAEVE